MQIREFQLQIGSPYSYQERIVEHDTFEEYKEARIEKRQSIPRNAKFRYIASTDKLVFGYFYHPTMQFLMLHIGYVVPFGE